MAKKHRVTRVVSNKKKNKNRRHSPNSRANESNKTNKDEPPQAGDQSQTKTSSNKNSKPKASLTKEDNDKEIEINSPDERHNLSSSPIQFEWIPTADFLPSAYTPSQINDHIDALHSDNVQIDTTSAATTTISIDVNDVAGVSQRSPCQQYPPTSTIQPSETAGQSSGIVFLQETQLEESNAASASSYANVAAADQLSCNENKPETDRQSPHQADTTVLSSQVPSEITQNVDSVPPSRNQDTHNASSHNDGIPIPETVTQSDNNKPHGISDNIIRNPLMNANVPINRGEESLLNTIHTHPQQNVNVPINRGEERPLNTIPTHPQQNVNVPINRGEERPLNTIPTHPQQNVNVPIHRGEERPLNTIPTHSQQNVNVPINRGEESPLNTIPTHPQQNVNVPIHRGEERPLNTIPTHPQQNVNVPINRGEESPLNTIPTHPQQNVNVPINRGEEGPLNTIPTHPQQNVNVPIHRGEERPLNTIPTHPQQNVNVPINRGEERPLNTIPTHPQQNVNVPINCEEIQPPTNNDKFLTPPEQITLSQTRVQSRVLNNVVNSDWNYVPNKENTTGCPKPAPDNPQYGVRHGERRSNNRPTARLCQNGRYLYPIKETPEHPVVWSPELSWNKEPKTLRAITKQRHDGEQNAAQIHNQQSYYSFVTSENSRIPETNITRHEIPPINGIISQTNASYSRPSQIVQQGNTPDNHLPPQRVFQDGTVIINGHGERPEPWRAPVTSSNDFNTTTTPPPIINQDKNNNNYVLPQQQFSHPPPLPHHHQQPYTIPPPTYNQINPHLQHQQLSSIPQPPPTYSQISPPPYHLQHPHNNNGIVVSQQPPPTYSQINHPPSHHHQQPCTSPQPPPTFDQINHLQHQQSSSIPQPPSTYNQINHPLPHHPQQPCTSPQPTPTYNQTSSPPYHLQHPHNNGIVVSQQQPIPNHHPTPVARPSMPNSSSRPPPTPVKTEEFAFFPSSYLAVSSSAMRAYTMARSNLKTHLPGRYPPCSYDKDRLRRSPKGIYPADPRDLFYRGEYFKIISPKPNEVCDCCFALWCHEMNRAFHLAGFQPPAKDYAHGLYCLAKLEAVRCPHHGELQIPKSEEWNGNPFPEASQRTLERIVEQLTEMEIITRTFHKRYQVESG